LKTKILFPGKHVHWWLGCEDTEVKLAVEHKGSWWLVPIEKKTAKKTQKPTQKNNPLFDNERGTGSGTMFVLFLAGALGVSLAFNLAFYLFK
jgi:hypothetical protein